MKRTNFLIFQQFSHYIWCRYLCYNMYILNRFVTFSIFLLFNFYGGTFSAELSLINQYSRNYFLLVYSSHLPTRSYRLWRRRDEISFVPLIQNVAGIFSGNHVQWEIWKIFNDAKLLCCAAKRVRLPPPQRRAVPCRAESTNSH